jgi:phage portal protein BeeE
MASWLDTLLKPFRGASKQEGAPREGPWVVHFPDGALPNEWGKHWNYWQMNYDPIRGNGGVSAVVEACVSAYAQTIAQCPGDHWRATGDGGRERVTNSALSRILRDPNDYQSRSDFILNLVRNLYIDGNSYHLATRNSRFEVDALHPFDPRQSQAIVGDDQQIFYELAGNNVLEADAVSAAGYDPMAVSLGGYAHMNKKRIVPARDVLHVKLEAERGNWLKGVPPLRHASDAIMAQRLIGQQLINFFGNMNRPPGVIETDLNFTKEQITELRARLNETWRGIDNLDAGPPILTNGMKFKGVAMSAKDSEVAQALKLTQDEIFMVYGVPPAILGLADKGTFSSTEALMQFWLSRGLGYAINHIEVAFDQFFGLKGWPDEYVEFDTRALLRVAYKDRIEALARGVQGGIYAPDEARNTEELPAVPGGYGKEPRVQQQVVPLSAWAQTENEQPVTPAPEAPEAPPAPPPAAEAEEEEKDGVPDQVKDMFALDAIRGARKEARDAA